MQVLGDDAPGGDRRKQSADGVLQDSRAGAQLRGLTDCLVDDRAQGRDIADQLAPHQLCLQELRFGCNKGGGQAVGDGRCQVCHFAGELPAGAAEICPGKYNAGADNPDADLARAVDGQHQHVATCAAGLSQLIHRHDRRGIAGERRRVGCKVLQDRRNKSARRAP